MTIHSCGAASAPALIWLAMAAVTATNGMRFIWTIRASWYPNRTCRPIHGWDARRCMTVISRKNCGRLRRLGVPYSDPDISSAKAQLANKTERDALIAYLQGLGTALKNVR